MRKLLRHEFRTFGPGYRDFECIKYGGAQPAHKILGAQIATGRATPAFSVTEFATPKRLYSEPSTSVPGYLLYNQSFVTRFQLAMPKARKWKAFADANGIAFVGPGLTKFGLLASKNSRSTIAATSLIGLRSRLSANFWIRRYR